METLKIKESKTGNVVLEKNFNTDDEARKYFHYVFKEENKIESDDFGNCDYYFTIEKA